MNHVRFIRGKRCKIAGQWTPIKQNPMTPKPESYNWKHIANYGPWHLFAGASESGPVYTLTKTGVQQGVEQVGIFFTIDAALKSRAIRRPFEGGADPEYL